MKRALLALMILTLAQPLAAQTGPAKPLAEAMELAARADWPAAADAAKPGGELVADIITWHQLRAGFGGFQTYRDFLSRRPDWPGLELLRERGEAAIPEDASADQVLSYFSPQLPRTGAGSLRLAAALAKIGASAIATDEVRRAWLTLRLTPDEQRTFLETYADSLSGLHAARLDLAIWQSRFSEADAMLSLVGSNTADVARARFALMRGDHGVDALIEAVPTEMQDDPGLAFARFKWRLRAGRRVAATELLLDRSTMPGGLARPEFWAGDRTDLAREALGRGDGPIAYRLAAEHGLTEGGDFAQLEWLAGYIALTAMDDPSRALDHFRRFRTAVYTPISLGRAGYWEGRALEALGREEEALQAYGFGAEFHTSFYGQLAAIAAGLPMQDELAGTETYPDLAGTAIGKSSVLAAALILRDAGQSDLFRRFLRHLAESGTAAEQGALADLALNLGEPYTAIYIAKYAAEGGAVVERSYFPVPAGFDTSLPIERALALAVARRESEFNQYAVSHVGARGLMQLMPRTAKAMGDLLGLKAEASDLTEKPSLNVTLGAAYLAHLIEEFDGYLPAVAAGYNAGPNRSRTWLDRNGDPRGDLHKAIDWIEAIPFDETRNYVMRVLEGYEVYRARLAGKPVDWSIDKVLIGGR